MTADPYQLLADLEASGVRLWAEAGGIHYRGPAALTPEQRASIVANKPALLAVLGEWDGPAALRLMHIADDAACGVGDDAEVQAHAGRFFAAYLVGDMANARKACALVEERARKLAARTTTSNQKAA
jgi:hypothetical protein